MRGEAEQVSPWVRGCKEESKPQRGEIIEGTCKCITLIPPPWALNPLSMLFPYPAPSGLHNLFPLQAQRALNPHLNEKAAPPSSAVGRRFVTARAVGYCMALS